MGISNKMDVLKTCALAKSKAQHQLVPITYIAKSTKNQKGKPGEMDLPLLKNDITTTEGNFQIQDTFQLSKIWGSGHILVHILQALNKNS